MYKKRAFGFALLVMVLLSFSSADAGLIDKAKKGAKKIQKKVEHKLGWDRYILCWGDRFVPPEDRWVAIRSAIPREKHNIGKFWDVAGDGKVTKGARKEIQLWGITFQEYPKEDRRYRFVSVYDRTKHPDDYGYYWIQAKTGMWMQARNKGQAIWLNKGYDTKNRHDKHAASYQWQVKNVGKNKFTIISRKNGLAIDAAGGKGKNGTRVQLWDDHGQTPVKWEFIYIAQGDEVKSTSEMAEKRAKEVHKMAKNVTNKFEKIANKVSGSVVAKVKRGFHDLGDNLITLKKQGNNYHLKVGFPAQENLYDKLKGKTIDKLFKLDFKKIKFEPTDNNKIIVGIINRIECLGHHTDLSVELTGDWTLGKDGFKIDHFVMNRFSLPLLPDSLTKGIRDAISKETKKLKIHIKDFAGMNKLANGTNKSPLKVSGVKKGPYGFEATLVQVM